MKLQGAVVAITGASSGIGRAAALAFARAGADVSLAARREDRLRALASEIETLGRRAHVRTTDVAVESDVHAFVDATVRTLGRLDVMVNNAGFGIRRRVEETPATEFERLMRTNFLGTVFGCQAALRVMREQGKGVILNVSSPTICSDSAVRMMAMPGGAAYAATKAAQISLTESLRAELRGTAIHAVSVHPIATATEFSEVATRESGGGRRSAPIGPVQTAEQVASAMVRAAIRPRAEVHPSFLARGLVALNAVAPGLVDGWAARAAPPSGDPGR